MNNVQDKNVENPETATEMFKLIAEAYSILSDPRKRREYDMYGRDGMQGESQNSRRSTRENMFHPSFVSMQFASDIFESFFGRGHDDFFSDPFFSPMSSSFPRMGGFQSPFSDMMFNSSFGPSLFSDPFGGMSMSSFSSSTHSSFPGHASGSSTQSVTTYENGTPVTRTTRTVYNPDGTSTTTTSVQRGNGAPRISSDDRNPLPKLRYR